MILGQRCTDVGAQLLHFVIALNTSVYQADDGFTLEELFHNNQSAKHLFNLAWMLVEEQYGAFFWFIVMARCAESD